MRCELVHPLSDSRWPGFVEQHPQACAFHTQGWLGALAESYGYDPVSVCLVDAESRLQAGLVFCCVRSWLTGSRLVSLPFTDHCAPLVDSDAQLLELLGAVERLSAARSSRYVELRPLAAAGGDWGAWRPSSRFALHTLSLERSAEKLFAGMHKDCMQRKVRRAGREGLELRSGRSEESLQQFYRLMIETRRRHGVVPQPMAWFRNLATLMGSSFTVHSAHHGGSAVAAIVTLNFRSRMIYKYGASDARYHPMGTMPALFWHAIETGLAVGATCLDLGRSDLDAPSLIEFKDRLGAVRSELVYWRLPGTESGGLATRPHLLGARYFLHIAPDAVLARAGGLLYRHFG